MTRQTPDKGRRPADSGLHASSRAKRRRLAAETRQREARILVCEHAAPGTPTIRAAIRALGFVAVACNGMGDALRETAETAVDLIIAVLPAGDAAAPKMLQLLRRSAPHTPIVIVSHDTSLEMRGLCQPVRPYFFAVPPLSNEELRVIVNGALNLRAVRAS